MALAWKAGWVNALAGSNPASSARSDLLELARLLTSEKPSASLKDTTEPWSAERLAFLPAGLSRSAPLDKRSRCRSVATVDQSVFHCLRAHVVALR
jgi:hypothetical protein